MTERSHIVGALPTTAVEAFAHNGDLSVPQIVSALGIARRTWARRRRDGRLSRDESDRLLRLTRVFGSALRLFEGDVAAARRWLFKSRCALGGAIPLDLVSSDSGSDAVECLIRQIEQGVFV